MNAVPETPRREHGEGHDYDCHDRGENEQGLQSTASARDDPDVGGRGRDEHERIELRAHGQPEQAEGEQVPLAQERSQRTDRQRRGKEVVGVQRDRTDRERREREEGGGGVEASPSHAKRHQHEHHGEERRQPAERHQALEREVERAAGQNRRWEKDGESARRILGEEVAVRNLAAQEPVGVDAVQVHVPETRCPKEPSVGNRACDEKNGRRQAGDPRGEPQLARF